MYLAVFLVLYFCTTADAGFFSESVVRIESFTYRKCSPAEYSGKYSFWVRDLNIMSTSEGDVDFAGTFITEENITSPLKATVELQRSFLGFGFRVPCFNNFGSCSINDLCEYGYPEDQDCPPVLQELDVPCRCPIQPGTYNISRIELKKMGTSNMLTVLSGRYSAILKIYLGHTAMTCYNIKFTLS